MLLLELLNRLVVTLGQTDPTIVAAIIAAIGGIVTAIIRGWYSIRVAKVKLGTKKEKGDPEPARPKSPSR